VPLFLVATPIGNLGDITLRAIETLRAAEVVIAEDTRRTRALLAHLGIEGKRLVSLPAFAEKERAGDVLEPARRGAKVALVTDAGSPGISDPGAEMVRRAVEEGIEVVPIPGATAAIAALQASALPTDRFLFVGFIPRKGRAREEALRELSAVRATLVLYESKERLRDTLADLRAALGDRRAAVGRELTKLHEEVARGTLSELETHFAGEVLGEVVIVVEGATEAAVAKVEAPLEEEVRTRLARGDRPTEVARALARERGLKRGDVYDLAVKLSRGEG
jgi:16S rRNA (cytidine1402-2'-O)-methyltransferase